MTRHACPLTPLRGEHFISQTKQFLCAFLLVAVPILIDVTALRHAGLLIEGER